MGEASRRSGYMPLSGAASARPLMINLVSHRGHRQILLATFSRPNRSVSAAHVIFQATCRRNLGLTAGQPTGQLGTAAHSRRRRSRHPSRAIARSPCLPGDTAAGGDATSCRNSAGGRLAGQGHLRDPRTGSRRRPGDRARAGRRSTDGPVRVHAAVRAAQPVADVAARAQRRPARVGPPAPRTGTGY